MRMKRKKSEDSDEPKEKRSSKLPIKSEGKNMTHKCNSCKRQYSINLDKPICSWESGCTLGIPIKCKILACNFYHKLRLNKSPELQARRSESIKTAPKEPRNMTKLEKAR